MNVPACRALSGKPREGGRSGRRKDPIVAKELKVPRHLTQVFC